MAFEHLTFKEKTLVEIVERYVWDNLEGVRHFPYGYETYIPQDIRNILGRFSVEDNPTARHIRHAPDALIVRQNADVLYLVDYKSTTVPMWSPRPHWRDFTKCWQECAMARYWCNPHNIV